MRLLPKLCTCLLCSQYCLKHSELTVNCLELIALKLSTNKMVLIKLSAVDSELSIAAGVSVLQTIQWAWRVSLGSFKASITDKQIRGQRFHVCKPLGCMKLCHPMSWQEASSLPLFPLPKVPFILYKPLPDLQEPTWQPAATAALVCPKAASSKARSCALHPPVSEPGQVTAISCLPSH